MAIATSLTHFRTLVDEIRANSWWSDRCNSSESTFTYSIDAGVESATNVPNEPFESLLLRVRRLVMTDSAENLLRLRKQLKLDATNETQRKLLDAWYKYWRIAFIKEPNFFEIGGNRLIMTPFKLFDCFINGKLFHSNIPEHNVVLYGSEQPTELNAPWLLLQTRFHATVADFCLASMGLVICADFLESEQITVSGHAPGVADFVWYRNRMDELDEQYRIFSDWIESNGGCNNCRWT